MDIGQTFENVLEIVRENIGRSGQTSIHFRGKILILLTENWESTGRDREMRNGDTIYPAKK